MYEIAATVTTAVPTELKLPAIGRSIGCKRRASDPSKFSANFWRTKALGSPLVALREEEILGNRANWPNLQLATG